MPMTPPPFTNYYRIWQTVVAPVIFDQIVFAAIRGYWLDVVDTSGCIVLAGRRQVARCQNIVDAAEIAALLAAFHTRAPANGATSSLRQAGATLAPSLAAPSGEQR